MRAPKKGSTATARAKSVRGGGVKRLRKGDRVVVIAGNDKGAIGDVKLVLRGSNPRRGDRVIVEGVNLRWKHKRPTQQTPQGERIQEECSIHASNVLFYDEGNAKGVRKRPQAGA
jgi:large subunit ribosomal protein L24